MQPRIPDGRTRQLRTAARGVRAPTPPPRDRPADETILSLVETPYTTVEETHRRLAALLDAFEARGDRRAVFLSIYARMTAAVGRRIDRGEFEDPDWVGAYLVAFANRYRRAVRDHEAGRTQRVATPWRLAFDAADRGDSLIAQDAALGVNAHINYDLALALDDAGIRRHRQQKYTDHCAVIEVIAGLVDDAQDSLAARDAPGLETLDDSLGRFDEWLTVSAIDECRDSAWRTAVALTSRFRARRRLARWLNDVTSTGLAHLIRSSQASDQLHETLADIERGAPDDS